MKKLVSVLTSLAVAICLFTGCGMKYNSENGKIKIVTTIFAAYDFSRQIAGDRADITLLLKPGSEAHSYEPTPADIVEIENCDIFIYVGGENDTWVDTILNSIDNSDMKIIKMLDLVDKYEEETVTGMEIHEEESDETEWDEHVWTDPNNAIIISENIKDELCEIDKGNSKVYEEAFGDYSLKLQELDKEFEEIVSNAKRKEVIFGDRFPLRYFVERYGLKYYAAFPGCASESEPSPKTVAYLIDKVKEDNIPVVFKIELSNGNIAESIANDTGAKVLTFYTCHNISKDDFENGETYLSLMEKNLVTLKEALN